MAAEGRAGRFDWERIDAELAPRLGVRWGARLDRELIERHAAQVASGRLSLEANRLPDPPGLPDSGEIEALDGLPDARRRRYAEIGRRALAQGAVAVAVLNGGMATRFGGGVKGVVEAFAGRSFLEIKRAQARALGPVPFLVMNSFATQAPTLEFLRERGLEDDVHLILQQVSLRLTPRGELFRGPDGALSPYAPGHGDLPQALRESGLLEALRGRGVATVLLSNVDNLGAEPDPVIVGYHLESGAGMTAEVVPTIAGDAGGAPMRVRGRLQLVEGFRFPEGYDWGRMPFVNTNTALFSLDALARELPLSWFYVEKRVAEQPVVQIEHLIGEVSAFVETAFLSIPRTGPRGRYYPVKSRRDLEAMRADPRLIERFSSV
ncbi:MAG: UTP--glucose-1-phosphate uridylyltransferase [Myxococcales bacterium]|nr:UTP--glucose-1-phosphate uridylyltransferase [Myxococcales bacterium]